jgi:hypothetical protein
VWCGRQGRLFGILATQATASDKDLPTMQSIVDIFAACQWDPQDQHTCKLLHEALDTFAKTFDIDDMEPKKKSRSDRFAIHNSGVALYCCLYVLHILLGRLCVWQLASFGGNLWLIYLKYAQVRC